jgi:hypothetical protein
MFRRGSVLEVTPIPPDVEKMPSSPERTKRFLDRCYEKLPFALSSERVRKQLNDRAQTFAKNLFMEFAEEPAITKRNIR